MFLGIYSTIRRGADYAGTLRVTSNDFTCARFFAVMPEPSPLLLMTITVFLFRRHVQNPFYIVSGRKQFYHFCHLIENNKIGEKVFADVKVRLEKAGLMMHGETIIDATIISAPGSTKNKEGRRDILENPITNGE